MSGVQRPTSDVRHRSNRDALGELLIRSGIAEGSDVEIRFLSYLALLEKWNARVNLTSTTDWELLGPLFEEAVWAAGLYPDVAAAHLDIGSGAGFPALLMRVLRPRMRLTMVEPRGKRAAFLETAAHELGLNATRGIQRPPGRVPEQGGNRREWDFVSWKALKLGGRELAGLLAQSGRGHPVLAVPRQPVCPWTMLRSSRLDLVRKESFPGKHSWHLSVLMRTDCFT